METTENFTQDGEEEYTMLHFQTHDDFDETNFSAQSIKYIKQYFDYIKYLKSHIADNDTLLNDLNKNVDIFLGDIEKFDQYITNFSIRINNELTELDKKWNSLFVTANPKLKDKNTIQYSRYAEYHSGLEKEANIEVDSTLFISLKLLAELDLDKLPYPIY